MFKNIAIASALTVLISGCTTVPLASKEESNKAKAFNAPSEGNAALYIYRPSSFGGALKKDITLDGKCIGASAPYVFFYEEVKSGEHTLSTESEFSPNDLILKTEPGKNYFVEQFIKPGVFVGGAGLELRNEDEAKAEIKELDLAIKGKCQKDESWD